MNYDGIIITSMVLSAFITGVCTVLTSLSTVRAAKKAKQRADKKRAEPIPPQHGRIQPLLAQMRLWKSVTASVSLSAFLILILIVQVVSLSRATSDRRRARGASDQAWQERVQSEEWLVWRKHIHEELSATPVSDETLIEVLSPQSLPKIVDENDQPAILRRDQAIADVLLSYNDVRTILKNRFGIDKRFFLGTGLSKPAGERHYSSASVHEYLIPNYPDTHGGVWAWQLKPGSVDFNKSIKQIVAGKPDERLTPINVQNGKLKDVDTIRNRVENRAIYKDRPAVIRFGKFPLKDYKNTLGRPDAFRVFASNLAEFWEMSLLDAANVSGYIPTAGEENTFFIWIFLPDDAGETVPATWGRVLSELPAWLKEAEGKGS